MMITDIPEILKRFSAVESDAKALVRLATSTKEGHQWLISGRIQVCDPSAEPARPRSYAYASLMLSEHWIEHTEALEVLRRLLQREEARLPDIGVVHAPELFGRLQRYQSGLHYPYFSSNWPVFHVECTGSQPQDIASALQDSDHLVAPDLPLYPSAQAAVLSFVHDCHTFRESGSSIPTLLALAMDRRARIAGMELRGTILTVKIQLGSLSSATVKLYGPAIPEKIREQGIVTQGDQVSVELHEKPEFVLVGLISGAGELLDERSIDFRWGSQQHDLTITPETREMAIQQWIEGGENDRIEFKLDVNRKDEQTKNEFLESVVAFANTHGGTIILGVTNNREVKGFQRDDFRDVLGNMLRAKCDPVPDYSVEEVTLNGNFLTLVHVQRTARPCCLDRTKFYIRASSSDCLPNRDELQRLFARPTETAWAGNP